MKRNVKWFAYDCGADGSGEIITLGCDTHDQCEREHRNWIASRDGFDDNGKVREGFEYEIAQIHMPPAHQQVIGRWHWDSNGIARLV